MTYTPTGWNVPVTTEFLDAIGFPHYSIEEFENGKASELRDHINSLPARERTEILRQFAKRDTIIT